MFEWRVSTAVGVDILLTIILAITEHEIGILEMNECPSSLPFLRFLSRVIMMVIFIYCPLSAGDM